MNTFVKFAFAAAVSLGALQAAPALAVCAPSPYQGLNIPPVTYVGSVTAAQNIRLYPGSSIVSPNGVYRLIFQGDGNLVLYKNGTQPEWATDTQICYEPLSTTMPLYTRFQSDGNLVVYHSNVNNPLVEHDVWDVNKQGNPNAVLRVQDDGNVVIYNGTKAIWARTW